MPYLKTNQTSALARRAGAMLFAIVSWSIAINNAAAQNVTVLTNFNSAYNPTGMNPSAPLIQGPDGTLYGTANSGGAYNSGVVFRTQPDGSGFSLIWSFSGGDGASDPGGGLLLVGDTLYGTTYSGGPDGDGILFSVETNGANFTVLHNFTGGTHDGANSTATLVLSGNTLYGTAFNGGLDDLGIVFSIETNGSNFKDLYDFKGGLDCGNPFAGLTLTNNVLYGTATGSSSAITDFGSIFKINPDGTGFTVLKTFKSGDGTGANPYGGLVELAGNLYGTTDSGTPGQGTVFRLSTNGSSFTTIYPFSGGNDGNAPYNTLALSGATLYGTTFSGGANGAGVIFRVSINGGGFANIYSFTNGNDGGTPYGGVILAGGLLYGAAFAGGAGGYGTIYKKNPTATGFSTLNFFEGEIGAASPVGPLALVNDTLYGMTQYGGTSLNGTIFSLNTNGSGLTTLRNFSGSDGASPVGGILQTNGSLFGATSAGGSNNDGVIFSIATDGSAFTNLHSFSGPDGSNPGIGLTLSDGVLYGTTTYGGPNNDGVLFSMATNGSGFRALINFSGTDGQTPIGQLVVANGAVYGVTSSGGAFGYGAVYRENTNGGGFILVHSFSTTGSYYTNNDGAYPSGQLVQQGNYLYGTTVSGGLHGAGAIFKVSLSGAFTVVSSFQEGYIPAAGLAVGLDNNLYGPGVAGGTNSAGTLFQLTPAGSATPVVSLGGQIGSSANTLTLAPNGNFFGSAADGGANYNGMIFQFNPNFPSVSLTSAYENILAGSNVVITALGAGEPPLFFQWDLNGAPVSGATNATLTLTNISPSQSGSYTVKLSNSLGSAEAGTVTLSVVPSTVTTYAAEAIGQGNATLYGAVSYGAPDTTTWFDWGTNTNYGSIAGFTVLPGNFGNTVTVSNLLSGLENGAAYHYRAVASNSFGVVYGNDVPFQVGSVPTVVTLGAADATAPDASLTASVNPHGLDTTVYFKWGSPFTLTNTTAVVDVGSGVAPLNVSALITGLAPAKQYSYQVVASNSLGAVFTAAVAFYTAPFAGVPNENWDSVASSADGSVLVAVANEVNGSSPAGPILISTNSGATWSIATGAPTNGWWETVACSADGSTMIAAGGGADGPIFPIYTSSDTGATWLSNNTPRLSWQSVASSADGARLVAAAEFNRVIYTSTNSGAVWTQATKAPKLSWFSVALSADGTKLAAVANGSTNIYTSPDFGVTWITNNVPPGPAGIIQRGWSSIASSADGSNLVAATGGNGFYGYIFLSTNSGTSWNVTATNIPSGLSPHPWLYVASSANGRTLAAVSDVASPLGVVITSTNSGATWATNAVPFLNWNAVALSADGAKLVASVGYPSTGPIYISQTTPAPLLSLSSAGGSAQVSWVIPSAGFLLQQSSDLSTWTDLTNQPALNLSNLQNQVLLPASADLQFYRLRSQ